MISLAVYFSLQININCDVNFQKLQMEHDLLLNYGGEMSFVTLSTHYTQCNNYKSAFTIRIQYTIQHN